MHYSCKTNETLIIPLVFKAFDDSRKTGLTVTAALYSSSSSTPLATGIACPPSLGDATTYLCAIPGTSLATAGKYWITATVQDTAIAPTLVSASMDAYIDVQPGVVQDIVEVKSALNTYLTQAVTDGDLGIWANDIIDAIESMPGGSLSQEDIDAIARIETLATQILQAVEAAQTSIEQQLAGIVATQGTLSTGVASVQTTADNIVNSLATLNFSVDTTGLAKETTLQAAIADIQQLQGVTIVPAAQQETPSYDVTCKAGDTVQLPIAAGTLPEGQYTWQFTVKPITNTFPLAMGNAVAKYIVVPAGDVFTPVFSVPTAGRYRWDIEGVAAEGGAVKTLIEGMITATEDVTKAADRLTP